MYRSMQDDHSILIKPLLLLAYPRNPPLLSAADSYHQRWPTIPQQSGSCSWCRTGRLWKRKGGGWEYWHIWRLTNGSRGNRTLSNRFAGYIYEAEDLTIRNMKGWCDVVGTLTQTNWWHPPPFGTHTFLWSRIDVPLVIFCWPNHHRTPGYKIQHGSMDNYLNWQRVSLQLNIKSSNCIF